ncbi:MAG: class I SAM-dependent methyltransferase [Actinomycetota bacterium]|nr:class I SAM-dependent methyltransferase [Actinomycetota bacterium]
MISKDLLPLVRPRPSDTEGLIYAEGIEKEGMILLGEARSQATGETYEIKDGYLELLKARTGADNVANLTNFLPGAGRAYEPLWRVRALSLLTGEPFPNERELGIITGLLGPIRSYIDLGCSAGLYTRSLSGNLEGAVGIDISPSMLREATRRASAIGAKPSFVRANAKNLPFFDASFAGAVCGGTLNEVGDPARVLRETYRVLEPGGRLAIMGILRAGTPRGRRLQRFLSAGGIRFFHPDELHSLLDHAGFEPDTHQTYGPVFFAGATRRD